MTAPDFSFPARIRIESTVDGDSSEQTVAGTVYRKSGIWYLRYEESDDAGERTRTFVKLAKDEWIVQRHGPVSGELRFAAGRESRGRYRIGGIELPLAIRLESASLQMEDRRGMARLEYGLSIGGEPERRHRVTYWIEPA